MKSANVRRFFAAVCAISPLRKRADVSRRERAQAGGEQERHLVSEPVDENSSDCRTRQGPGEKARQEHRLPPGPLGWRDVGRDEGLRRDIHNAVANRRDRPPQQKVHDAGRVGGQDKAGGRRRCPDAEGFSIADVVAPRAGEGHGDRPDQHEDGDRNSDHQIPGKSVGRIVKLRDEVREERQRQRLREDKEEERPADAFDGVDAKRRAFIAGVERETLREGRSGFLRAPGVAVDVRDGRVEPSVEPADPAEDVAGHVSAKITRRNVGQELSDRQQRRRKRSRHQQTDELERHQARDDEDGEDIEGNLQQKLRDDVGPLAEMKVSDDAVLVLDRGRRIEIFADTRRGLLAVRRDRT